MPNSDTIQSDYSAGLRLSLFLHLGLLLTVIAKYVVFPGRATPMIPALRVDIVGLPELLKRDLKAVPRYVEPLSSALKEATRDAKDIDPMVFQPKHAQRPNTGLKQRSLRNALDRIKALEKLNSLSGNIISEGSSLSGNAKEGGDAPYYELLRGKLQENWTLPTWIQRQRLSAQVRIFIDSKGILRGTDFEKSSGNAHFDDAVKRTLQESQPFPPPPESLSPSLLSNGILIGFPL